MITRRRPSPVLHPSISGAGHAVAKIPTRRLATSSVVFEVLQGEANRPTASIVGKTTVDLGMLSVWPVVRRRRL